MKNKNIAIRTFTSSYESREENGAGIIEGRPVVLEQVTDLGFCDEVIDRNALANTDLTDVRLCQNHDTSYVYARSRRNNGNSTMQIYKDEQGLGFRANLNTESSPKAQDMYSAVSRGDMDKMSFMFMVDKVAWERLDTDHPLRRILSIKKIFEISIVTFPAYEGTSVYSRSDDELDSIKSDMEIARAQLANSQESENRARLAKARYNYLLSKRREKE